MLRTLKCVNACEYQQQKNEAINACDTTHTAKLNATVNLRITLSEV